MIDSRNKKVRCHDDDDAYMCRSPGSLAPKQEEERNNTVNVWSQQDQLGLSYCSCVGNSFEHQQWNTWGMHPLSYLITVEH